MTHKIALQNAAEMTQRYRQNKESILAQAFQFQNLLSLCETFDRTAVDHLLGQPGCTALRIYYGMDIELKVHALLVGVDAANADILPTMVVKGDTDVADDDEYIAEQAIRCPPTCPPDSPLNEP